MKLLDASPASFIGEDIEISLSLLSNYASKKHLNRNEDLQHNAYQKLGLLMNFANRAREYRAALFGVPLENHRRVCYKIEDEEAVKVTTFLRQWITDTKVRGVLMYEKRGASAKVIGQADDERRNARREFKAEAVDFN